MIDKLKKNDNNELKFQIEIENEKNTFFCFHLFI